jgi:hypothetical protein
MATTIPPPSASVSPTTQASHELQLAFDFFNAQLFQDKLPSCLVTLQRKGSGTFGYYCPSRFGSADGRAIAEIAINPRHIKNRSFAEVMSTLVHEMAHHWQFTYGAPSRTGYHNREWAEKMCWLGLRPSRTGHREGPMTGQSMTHWIIPGGRFEQAFQKFRAMVPALTWFDIDAAVLLPKALGDLDLLPPASSSGRRTVYRCPKCRDRADGKPTLHLICGKCDEQMLTAGFR